jgi:tRNA pseudouridine13 synthase
VKLRRLPEDFQVDEQSSLPLGGGRFAVYRLKKRSLGTLEALDAVARRWDLPKRRISFGGLKDKHALTTQHITIDRGPKRDLSQENLEVRYIGQASRPFTSAEIGSNRFRVTLRELAAEETLAISEQASAVARDGVPNYFDDQRFGSLTTAGEFVAAPWCRGEYERAVQLAAAEPNPHDRPRDARCKEVLRRHWGDWRSCLAEMPRFGGRSLARDIAEFLSEHPGDYRRAITVIPAEQRSLYLAAYQSFLWNKLLAAWLRESLPSEALFEVPLATGAAPFHRTLDVPARGLLLSSELPLPSARLHLEDGPRKSLVDRVLSEWGIELRQLRVKYPRDSFFSKGERRAIVVPDGLTSESMSDELYPAVQKLTLAFELARGAYATILVKRVTEA